MARPTTLFPDDPAKAGDDIKGLAVIDGYHRTAERHFRELDRLNNCRQILFASNIGVVRFETRSETTDGGGTVDVTYAIQDLYTIHRNPEDLAAPPRPEVFTRHEVALRDLHQKQPAIKAGA